MRLFTSVVSWLALLAVAIAARGEEVRPPITALAFSPDGEFLVVGSQAGIEIRSLSKLTLERTFKTTLSAIHDLSFSPEGSRLAAGGGKPGVRGACEVFRWPEGELARRMADHKDCIYRVAWRDENRLATAGHDGLIALHQTDSDESPRTLLGHSAGVTSLEFLSGSDQMLSGSLDGSLRLWNLAEGEVTRSFEQHTGPVLGLAFRPAGEGLPLAVSIGGDRTVRWWQPTIGRMVRFARLPSVPQAVAWSGDGRHVAVACYDGAIRVLDPETAEVLREQPAMKGPAYSLRVDSRGRIAVGGAEGALELLENLFPK